MKKGIIITFIVIAGALIYYFAGNQQKINESAEKDSIKTSKIIPSDYAKLMGNTENLSFDQTITSRRRNPIVQFNYGNHFRINLYKINLLGDVHINAIITETHDNSHITYGLIYNLVDGLDQHEIFCKSGFQDRASKIYLNLFGDDTRVILKNDTIAYYYSRIENFYVKYQLNSAQDFFGGVKDANSTVKIPIEIMFIKRNNNVYLIILSAKNEGVALKPGTLLNLLAYE